MSGAKTRPVGGEGPSEGIHHKYINRQKGSPSDTQAHTTSNTNRIGVDAEPNSCCCGPLLVPHCRVDAVASNSGFGNLVDLDENQVRSGGSS